jgi:hypothetical protein
MPGHADPRVTKSLMCSEDWKLAPVPEEGAWGQGDKLYGALVCLQYWLFTAARTSEGGPLDFLTQELLIYITYPALRAGPLRRYVICMQICGVELLQWPGTGPPQKGGDGSSSEFMTLNLHRCVALIANSTWNLATENLLVSPVPPHQLELATRKASGDSKGRKYPWNTATQVHGQYLCLSRGVGMGNNTPEWSHMAT